MLDAPIAMKKVSLYMVDRDAQQAALTLAEMSVLHPFESNHTVEDMQEYLAENYHQVYHDLNSRFGKIAGYIRQPLREAIEKANAVPYGLAAYGFTNRADYVDRMVEYVEAGNVSINTLEASLPETPFGGVKSSGFGREGGTEGLHNYMITKNLSHSLAIV